MRTRNSNPVIRQREQAKLGMAVSLGALVATGFLSRMAGSWSESSRTVHLCAGVALVGFSYWHWTLYQQNATSKGRFA
jgi:hypothetical protein